MRVLSIIAGILVAIFGFVLIFTPVRTFLATGYFLAIMLGVFGIIGIVNNIKNKTMKSVHFVFAIISTLLGIFMVFVPSTQLVAEGIVLIIVAVWFILNGGCQIWAAIQGKQNGVPAWGWSLAFGILSILLGIFALIQPAILAVALGFMVGFFFIEIGLSLIGMGTLSGPPDDGAVA